MLNQLNRLTFVTIRLPAPTIELIHTLVITFPILTYSSISSPQRIGSLSHSTASIFVIAMWCVT
jgi:hypothetical protein